MFKTFQGVIEPLDFMWKLSATVVVGELEEFAKMADLLGIPHTVCRWQCRCHPENVQLLTEILRTQKDKSAKLDICLKMSNSESPYACACIPVENLFERPGRRLGKDIQIWHPITLSHTISSSTELLFDQ